MNKQKRVAIALDLAKPDGRRKLAGLMRYQALRRVDWDLRIKRGPDEFLAEDVEALPLWNVDGIIYSIPARGEDAIKAKESLLRLRIPLVVIDPDEHGPTWSRRPATAVIRMDARAVAEAAASHFLSRGVFHSFGYVAAKIQPGWGPSCGQEFMAALAAKDQSCAHYEPFVTNRDDFQKLRDWLRSQPKPLALLVPSDTRACTVYAACQAEGLSIPEDVSVLSVDDDELLCQNISPTLSSIRPDHEKAGYMAGGLLSMLMRKASVKRPHSLVYPIHSLSKRASTRPTVLGSDLVQKALAFIQANARKGISPENVVRYLNVSRSLAELRFRELQGETIRHAIETARMEAVRQMLTTSDRTIKEIAADCSYSDEFYMMRVFKRRFGMTLGEYRRYR